MELKCYTSQKVNYKRLNRGQQISENLKVDLNFFYYLEVAPGTYKGK